MKKWINDTRDSKIKLIVEQRVVKNIMEVKQMQLQNLFIYIIDCICVVISYILASYLRFGNLWGGYTKGIVLIRMGILLMAITLIYFVLNPNRKFFVRNKKQEMISVFRNVLLMGAAVTMVAFLMQDAQDYSRLVYGYFCCIDLVVMFGSHQLYKKYMNDIYSKGVGTRNVLILTTEDRAAAICENIQENNSWNISIKGIILVGENQMEEISGVSVVCKYEDMMEYIRKNVVDEVFIHLPSQVDLPIKKIIRELEVMGVIVELNINVFEMEIPVQREIEKIGNYYAVSFSPKIHSFKQIFFKRIMDIAGAVVGLSITMVVTVFLAPVLLIESPGPLFFSQVRVGKNGRRFRIYKFRSMYMDAEERKKELLAQNEMEGLMFKIENDPRVTKVGKFIRKTSIDELPQFWNILKGEMSLVGTRPPTEDEFLQYEGYHRRRLSTTPGLTGLWQVSGRSNTKNFEEIVAMDVEYIDNWSLLEDIKILFKTVGVVLKGKGAS